MEGYNGGVKGYWKRKEYQRLDGGGERTRRSRRKNHHRRVELGGGGGNGGRKRFWRIKITPRLRFLSRAISPRRFLARIRDAYVRMMLGFANSKVFSSGSGYVYGGDIAAFGRPTLKEYDEKMIVEIYKSLMAQGHLIAAAKDGAGQTAQIIPRR